MRTILIFAFIFTCALALTKSVQCQAVDEQYEVRVETKIKIDMELGEQNVEANSGFQYRINRTGQVCRLIIDSAQIKATINGNNLMDAQIDKDRFQDPVSGADFTPEAGAAQANALSSFSVPVLEFEVDEQGRETSSKLLVENDADLLVATGDYRHARMFHPPFIDDQDKWTAPMEFSIGEGGFIEGDINYELVGEEGDLATVRLRGELTGETSRRGIDCDNIKYQLEGTQVFDRSIRKWVSGNLDVDLGFDMMQSGESVATASGTMKFEFKATDD